MSDEIRRIEDPEELARLIKEYPPPPCASCGGMTGIIGTPGLMAYVKASGVKIVCSKDCEDVATTQLALAEGRKQD